jgi:hypothetical protein
MPRTTANATTTGTANVRRRRTRSTTPVVDQITQLVTQNEQLQVENANLRAVNEGLRAQLGEIGEALGRVAGGRRSRRGAGATAVAAPARRTRKPITDPAVIEKRRQALVRARAARAERIAAARAASAQAPTPTE